MRKEVFVVLLVFLIVVSLVSAVDTGQEEKNFFDKIKEFFSEVFSKDVLLAPF